MPTGRARRPPEVLTARSAASGGGIFAKMKAGRTVSEPAVAVAADRVGHAGDAVAFEERVKATGDARDEREAFIDHARVKLDGRCAGADLGIGVRRRSDATDADDGHVGTEGGGEAGEHAGLARGGGSKAVPR